MIKSVLSFLLVSLLISCSSWRTNDYVHKTSYQIQEFELSQLAENADASAERVEKISEELGVRKLTEDNFPLLHNATNGYLLEFRKGDLLYFLDVETLRRGVLTLTFQKEKYYLKKVFDSDFRKMSSRMFSKMGEEYHGEQR